MNSLWQRKGFIGSCGLHRHSGMGGLGFEVGLIKRWGYSSPPFSSLGTGERGFCHMEKPFWHMSNGCSSFRQVPGDDYLLVLAFFFVRDRERRIGAISSSRSFLYSSKQRPFVFWQCSSRMVCISSMVKVMFLSIIKSLLTSCWVGIYPPGKDSLKGLLHLQLWLSWGWQKIYL